MRQDHQTRIHVRVSRELAHAVDEYAKALYVSRSDYIRLALAEKMQRDETPAPLLRPQKVAEQQEGWIAPGIKDPWYGHM